MTWADEYAEQDYYLLSRAGEAEVRREEAWARREAEARAEAAEAEIARLRALLAQQEKH